MICRMYLILCSMLSCLLFAGVLAVTEPTMGATPLNPEQTVAAVQDAIDTADYARLNALMDVDGIIGHGVDIFLARARTPEGQAALPPLLAMTLGSIDSSPQGRQIARGLLLTATEEFIRFGVRTGAFAGKGRAKPENKDMWSTLFDGVSLGRKEIQQVGKAVPDNESAHGTGSVVVPCVVHDYGSQQTYIVEAVLRKNESGAWRIVALRNMNDLMDQVNAESKTL